MIRNRRSSYVSGDEYVETDANDVVGPIPLIYHPSCMIHNSFPEIFDKFGVTPGPWGFCRANFPAAYKNTGTNLATGDATMVANATEYFTRPLHITAMSRGTLLIEVHVIQHRSSNPSGTWNQIAPLDLSAGGAYQQTCQVLFNHMFNVMGLKAAEYIGDTGVMVHGYNEVDSPDGTEGWLGTPTEYKLMTHRCYSALKSVRPNAKMVVPTVIRYNGDIATEGIPAIRSVCDYFAANGLELGGIDVHTFQAFNPKLVKVDLYEAQALIQASLAANNLPLNTPVISTEYQNNNPEPDVRTNEVCAAYLASTLFERRRAGWTAAAMAALPNLGSSIHPEFYPDATVANSLASWGMVVYGTTGTGWASTLVGAKPSLMLMRLFALWTNGGQEIRSNRSNPVSSNDTGLSVFSAKKGNSTFQLVSRYDSYDFRRNVRLVVKNPGGTLAEARIYRFDATTNNPKYVFNTSAGTPDQRAAIAIAAGDTPTYTTTTTLPITLNLGAREAAFVQYIYA